MYDPSQYVTDRQLVTITMSEFLAGFHNKSTYAGNQTLPANLESVLNITPPSFGE